MPSPFPGMDPYLEGRRWMGFHHQLVSEIARQLARAAAGQAPLELLTVTPEQVPQCSIEIRDTAEESGSYF